MLQGSSAPSMEFMQGVEQLQMFKGAPAHGEYPAEPQTMTMEGMEMQGVPVKMVAQPNDSNNYHFMPHVAWIEPGTQVIWSHADIQDISEPRAHSVTSFGANYYFPTLIPPDAHTFDSGYIPGLHGQKSQDHGIDHRFNSLLSQMLKNHGNPLGRGPFTHTFEHEGVYLYYCQNHHMFKMAGAIVVGELWGEGGTASVDHVHGWSPAMTADTERIEQVDEAHGSALHDQVHELREMIHSGGEMMGGH